MPQINAAGLNLLKEFEGCELTAYADSGGVMTIGYGHTDGVTPGETITQAQADEFLVKDVAWAESAVETIVEVDLTPNQFSALVCFVYNIGTTAFEDSSLLAAVNDKFWTVAANQFGRWVYAGGQLLPGLVRRRNAERSLFQTPG